MSATTASATAPKARRRGVLRGLGVALLVLVPLLIAGTLVAAFSDVANGIGRVPAMLVNDDEMVTQTADDGTETQVLAGRLLVTELTSADNDMFDWTITNQEEADRALASGEAYVVLTIPEDFSASVVSLQGDDPVQANLSIVTDDAHSYLAGVLTEQIGDSLAAALGQELSEQVIKGLYTGISTLGESLGEAADGAGKLADGADQLADGADQLADGTAQLADGTQQLADGAGQLADGAQQAAAGSDEFATGLGQYLTGVRQYVGGVEDFADGVGTLADQTAGLGQLGTGVEQYTGGVAMLSEMYSDDLASILASPAAASLTPAQLEALAVLSGTADPTVGLPALAAGGEQLATGAAALGQLEDGIGQLADGAEQLAAGGAPLAATSTDLASGATALADGSAQLADGVDQTATGAQGLADGTRELADGVPELADGASQLADGTHELADGLADGAEQVPSYTDDEIDTASSVAAQPVTASVSREHEIGDAGQALIALFVPIGLWIGALAVVAIGRGLRRDRLASTASTGRLVFRDLATLAGITVAQAVVVTLVLGIATGLAPAAFFGVLGVAVLAALVFATLHQALTAAFGRGGAIVSLVLLALQLVAVGGLIPVQIIAAPFQAIAPVLPLGQAVTAVQTIAAGGVGGVPGSLAVLVLYGLAALAITLVVVARRRSARALGIVPALA